MLDVLHELTKPWPGVRWLPRFLVPSGDYDTIQALYSLGELLPHEVARRRLQELSTDRRTGIASSARQVLLTHQLEQEGRSKEEIVRRLIEEQYNAARRRGID